MRSDSLKGKTAVVTGASSGIGKAIALTLAREGMNLVLAARRESALEETVKDCEALGGLAVAVKTDVTVFNEVENLIGKARTFFGNIDVWINDAGAGAMGEFTETPIDIHEQIIRTNLLGYIYGTYVVLPYFKAKRKGTIINIVSVGAYVQTPYAAAYAASKFGLRGFNESVRAELSPFKDIHICDVNPAFIDTPGLEHVANFTGKELHPAPPLYDPFQVARAVLKLIHKPRNSVMVGASARAARFMHALAPNLLGKIMSKSERAMFKGSKEAPFTQGGVFTPVPQGRSVRGGRMIRPSFLRKYFSKKYLFPLRH